MSRQRVTSPKPMPDLPQGTFAYKRRAPVGSASKKAPPTPLPPRPPVKAGSESRVFDKPAEAHRPEPIDPAGARAGVMTSPFYNSGSAMSFFEQTFEILEMLGEGSFAKVYRARKREDLRIYAVKVSKQQFKGRADRDRKLREVARMKALGVHGNCVRIYEAWQERNYLYMQMEYCEKGSLALYCRSLSHPVPEPELWSFMADIMLALEHLHANNTLHLDVKPANVFLTKSGLLKLGDFGTAGQVGSVGLEEGDPVFMAPELAHDCFDKPADIFSAALTILDLGCDVLLPRGGDPGYSLFRTGNIPEECFSVMSPELRALLCRMAHPDPSKRPTAVEVLQHPRVMQAIRARRRNRLWTTTCFVLSALWDVVCSVFIQASNGMRGMIHRYRNSRAVVMVERSSGEDEERSQLLPSTLVSDEEGRSSDSDVEQHESPTMQRSSSRRAQTTGALVRRRLQPELGSRKTERRRPKRRDPGPKNLNQVFEAAWNPERGVNDG
eukprot:m.28965 g.28965  ORF g.28965 m.28965 type:complete len:497 (+) comp8988_c0_seq1:843-2333(+)